MAGISWKAGTTGDWNQASNWSSGTVPAAGDAVTIAAAGAYDVVLDDAESAQSIALASANATLLIEGAAGVVLTLGGNLNATAGTLSVIAPDTSSYGSITGGTVTLGASATLLAQSLVADPNGSNFRIDSVVSLAGTTTIAADTILNLYGGGALGGTIGGAGNLSLQAPVFSSTTPTFTASIASLSGLGTLSLDGPTLIVAKSSSGTLGGDVSASSSGSIVLLGSNTLTIAGACTVQYGANLLVGSFGSVTLAEGFYMADSGQIFAASGATVTAKGDSSIGNLLDSTSNNAVYGAGTFASTGSLTVDYVDGNTDFYLGKGITWINSGTAELFSPIGLNLIDSDHVTITNQAGATLNLQNNSALILNNMQNGTDMLSNAGTLGRGLDTAMGSDTGTSTIGAVVSNTGFIDVETGTLALLNGGTLGGTLAGPGILLLSAGTFTIGNLTGSGHLAFGAGATINYGSSPTINTGYTLDNNRTLAIEAGKTLTLSGAFDVGDASGGGTISGPGTLATSGATTIADLSPAQVLGITGGITWVNTGSVTDSGLVASTGGTILNKGTFNLASDDAVITNDGNPNFFTNTGTLAKTGGTGSSTIADMVNSTGSINVATGALVLAGGGSVSGTLSGAGALHLSTGAFTTTGLAGGGHLVIDTQPGVGYGTLTASATGTIAAAVRIDGGGGLGAVTGVDLTLSGALAIDTVDNPPSPNGGTLSGGGTITTLGAATIGGFNSVSAPLDITGGITWINAATGSVSDGGQITSTGGSIVNKGAFNVTADAGGISNDGNPNLFTNTGTLAKTGGTGISTISDVVNSTGSIDVATGALVLGDGGSVSGTLTGAGTLHLGTGAFTTTGLAGGGNLVIDTQPGVGYGTLTASVTSTITAAVRIDGGGGLGAVAGADLTLTNGLAIDTIDNPPSPNGGTLTGAGTITTLAATTIGTFASVSAPLDITGGITWINAIGGSIADGGLITSTGGTIVNHGTFMFASDAGSITNDGNPNMFINTGTLGKSAGTGTSFLGDVISSSGTIDVVAGALVLGDGGSVTGSLIGAGTLHLSNGAFTTAGLAGGGSLVIDDVVGVGYGTLTASATSSIAASVRIDGNGSLGAAAGKTLTLTNGLAIDTVQSAPAPDGGTLAGLGTITTMAATTIGDVANGAQALGITGGLTWINAATGTVSDSGLIASTGGTIANKGVFNLAGDHARITNDGNPNLFTNSGTLEKTGGTGTSLIADAVNSTGTVNVATGALVLGDGGSVSGSLIGAGTLHLGNGSFTTAGLSGTGSLVVDYLAGIGYGTLTASATSTITDGVRVDGNGALGAAKGVTLTLSGAFAVDTVESAPAPDGGTLVGLGTLTTTGAATIGNVANGAQALDITGGLTWINAATGTVSDSGLIASTGGTIINKGVFDLTGNAAGITNDGNPNFFTNTGTLAKNGGTGTSTIADAVTNTGTIEAAIGTLALTGGLSGTGVLRIDAGATLEVGAVPATELVTFNGGAGATLRLDTAASFGTLAGFSTGDRLDFAGNPVNSATIKNNTLTVVTGAGSFTYVSAGLAGGIAAISNDTAGGSFVSIYRAAAATHTPEPLAFGNHHVGDMGVKLGLTVANSAVADGYSEKLNASLGAATAGFTASGAVTALAAGASNSSALSVTLNTATAGAKTGTATLTLASNGAGVDGNGVTPITPAQIVNLTGAVYSLAKATLAGTSVNIGRHHVGQAATGFLSLANSAAAGAFSEKLDASFIGASGTGTVSLLAAGASNSTSLALALAGTTAGVESGGGTLSFISDGQGTSGLGTTTLGTQTVSATGTFYNLAVGHLASATLNLGVVHAGTNATGAISLTNAAATGGFSEALDAKFSALTGTLGTAGAISLLAAGATDSTTLALTLNESTSGAYTGSAHLLLTSDGAGTSGLGTTPLGTQTVNVTATVDNYALAAFEDPAGPALAGTSTNETLNLGSVGRGAAALSVAIGARNSQTGLSDLLGGTLTTAGAAGFANSGFGTFTGLAAGHDEHAQMVSLSTSTAGTFTETVILSSYGTNASGYKGALTTETLTITGTITPTFTTYVLAAGPNTITGTSADGPGDIFVAGAGTLNSYDHLSGEAGGVNSIKLVGAGLFDVGAAHLANIPTINATEGQGASGTHPDTRQTVLLSDSVSQTLVVAGGIPAGGNPNAEAITIYNGSGTNVVRLANGQDQVFNATGNLAVTLGGAQNRVNASGGITLVKATVGQAAASVVGGATGQTTLEIINAGAATLNAADTHMTVKMDAAGTLRLGALGFITATGSAGADTIMAGGTGQTLTGGLGADILTGFSGGGDIFSDTAAGLNGDTIGNWTTGDRLDLTNIVAANLHALSFAGGKLTVTDGTISSVIGFGGAVGLSNFTVLGSDGHGGTLLGFHS